jgi:hypothetical protein
MERHELAGICIWSFPRGGVTPVSFGPEELGVTLLDPHTSSAIELHFME